MPLTGLNHYLVVAKNLEPGAEVGRMGIRIVGMLWEILPPATVLWVSDKVRSGQSTVLVVVDETPMPLAA